MGFSDEIKKRINERNIKNNDKVNSDSEDSEDSEKDSHNIVAVSEFKFYDNIWVIAPFMTDILKKRFDLIPIECVLTMYILRSGNISYYVVLENQDSGDDFSIYEFEWIGADGERTYNDSATEKQEDRDPEFVEYATNMTAIDSSKFLIEKISEGYYIYIQKRDE
jgi:hypothetical protein